MKNLTDSELIVLYHMTNVSDDEFENSLEYETEEDKQILIQLHHQHSFLLFNMVDDEINKRNIENGTDLPNLNFRKINV